jgi:hypothetical protein
VQLGWAETFGGVGHNVNFSLAVDSAGVVHLTGYYRDSFDFDPDPFATYGMPTTRSSAAASGCDCCRYKCKRHSLSRTRKPPFSGAWQSQI